MGEVIEVDFGFPPLTPAIEDAVDAFVTFKILKSEIRFTSVDEYRAAAADLSELAVEQRALLDALSPDARCRAINLGQQQLNAERLGQLPVA